MRYPQKPHLLRVRDSMFVKIKRNKNGEHFLSIPIEALSMLGWSNGDSIQWIDNGNGGWNLKKLSNLDELKLKAFQDPEVKAEYDRLQNKSSIKKDNL